jgi:hypothetical protein
MTVVAECESAEFILADQSSLHRGKPDGGMKVRIARETATGHDFCGASLFRKITRSSPSV